MRNDPIFAVIKFAKDSFIGLKQPLQRAKFKAKNHPHQRNRAREIARKLETVNDGVKAKTSHLVPPERT
ncbi:hypothetical protein D5E81_25300 [Vibrio parahaemolyticus]|nr:hypothetical protein [Vibrio parahaemolyticus]EGR1345654.1 hypothetical protein [Vibrio parahaemolyticus]EGR3192493.1 hypothetical protein [Vibrio parahaemolyticus]EGR3208030.1 hypothetical protein [Vibrio parahaemolyticus]EGR3446115.1 hypothetical protein [Vibrio parahaemolyticus]